MTEFANSGGGDVAPLVDVRWVDASFAGTPRDGSIDHPFQTIAEAMADPTVTASTTLLFAPGEYNPATFTKGVQCIGLGKVEDGVAGSVTFGPVDIDAAVSFWGASRIVMNSGLQGDNSGAVVLDACSVVGGGLVDFPNVSVMTVSGGNLQVADLVAPSCTLSVRDCNVSGDWTLANLFAKQCQWGGGAVLANVCEWEQVDADGGVQFTIVNRVRWSQCIFEPSEASFDLDIDDGAELEADQVSLSTWYQAGGDIVPAGGYFTRYLDCAIGPSQLVFPAMGAAGVTQVNCAVDFTPMSPLEQFDVVSVNLLGDPPANGAVGLPRVSGPDQISLSCIATGATVETTIDLIVCVHRKMRPPTTP